MESNLENLKALVVAHRREKKRGQYPTAVWASVAELRREHSVEEISRATGISSTHIYRKLSRKVRGVFREVALSAPVAVAKMISVDLRRSDGAELRLRIEATREELSSLFAEFLR